MKSKVNRSLLSSYIITSTLAGSLVAVPNSSPAQTLPQIATDVLNLNVVVGGLTNTVIGLTAQTNLNIAGIQANTDATLLNTNGLATVGSNTAAIVANTTNIAANTAATGLNTAGLASLGTQVYGLGTTLTTTVATACRNRSFPARAWAA